MIDWRKIRFQGGKILYDRKYQIGTFEVIDKEKSVISATYRYNDFNKTTEGSKGMVRTIIADRLNLSDINF